MNWRTWVVLVLAALTVGYRVVDRAQNSAGRILDMGFEMRQVEGGVLLQRSASASFVGSASTERLRDADVVRAVTVRGTRTDTPSRTRLTEALRPLDDGEIWVAHVDRVGEGRLDLLVPAAATPWPLSWLEVVIPLGFTAVTLVTALLLVWLRPGDHVVYIGAMLFLCLSYVVSSPLAGLPTPWRELGAVLQGACSSFLPYLFFRFFALFPSPGWVARRAPWIFGPLLAATAVAAAGLATTLLVEVDALADTWRIEDSRWTRAAWTALFLSMLVGGVLSLVAQYRYARSATARRRLGIVTAGLAVGVVPLLLYLTAASITGSTASAGWLWAAIAVVLCLPIFPASFAYAVVRHRVLGVDTMLRRGAQYLLVSRALLALEFVLVFGVVYFVARPASGWFVTSQHPVIVTLSLVAVASLLLLGAVRLNRLVQPAIDRRFFRERYESARVLSELAGDVKRLAAEPRALLSHVASELAQALRSAAYGVVDLESAQGRSRPVVEIQAAGDEPHPPQIVLDRAAATLAEDQEFLEWASQLPPDGVAVLDATDPVPWRPLAPRPPTWQPSVVVPVGGTAGPVAALLLGEKLSEEPFSRRDRSLVCAASSQAAIALDYGRLIREAAQQESFRRDLEVAQEVQAHLFPRHPPNVPGLDFAGACRPARTIGGDYYDAIALGDGRLAVAVGDVAGKGVGAALLMASLQASLRSLLAPESDLADVVAAVNRLVTAASAPGKFATLFVGLADPRAGTLTYVNAGHNPPLLRRPEGGLEALMPTGMAIALLARATYEAAVTPFRAGDLLLVFTDGVTEAMDASGALYGDQRLSALLASAAAGDAASLRDLVLADVEAFAGDAARSDDVTVAVVRSVEAAAADAGRPR